MSKETETRTINGRTDTKPLTAKQEKFVSHLIQNPQDSAAQAVRVAGYKVKDNQNAAVIASENLRNPKIVSKLGKYNNLIERTIIGTIRDFGKEDSTSKRSLALQAAMWTHDKVHGKATQQITSVNLDFTGHIKQKSYGI